MVKATCNENYKVWYVTAGYKLVKCKVYNARKDW